MAISEHKNGHFEEIREWLQILELGYNSTILYLSFDTHDSSGAIFIWKWEIYWPHLLVCVWRGEATTHYAKVQKYEQGKIGLQFFDMWC